MTKSMIFSPLGVRMAVGLVAPFLSDGGKAEVEKVWGVSPDDLYAEANGVVDRLAAIPALHAAVAVWSRLALDSAAQDRLGDLLRHLPESNAEAQDALNRWTSESTLGLIEKAPVQVREDTDTVLASALAMDDEWAQGPYKARRVRFSPQGEAPQDLDGFSVPVNANNPETTLGTLHEGQTVVLTMPLSDEVSMTFALHEDGPEKALKHLRDGGEVGPLGTDHPLVSLISAPGWADFLAVIPEFKTTTQTALLADASRWGLVNASHPDEGAPGMHPDMFVMDAQQTAMIEVSRTGVKAAAVTMMLAGRSAAVPSSTPAVVFDKPFAYAITLPGLKAPLFEGIYAG